MHLGDSIFIFILALVLFGPKKLPEMARQIGKLMAEFRRASNEFRSQMDEELRAMERVDREKKIEAERAAATVALPAPAATQAEATGPAILPPSTGEPIGANNPFVVSAPAETAPSAGPEEHPLLEVNHIPHDPHATATGLAAAEANAARLNGTGHAAVAETTATVDPEGAPVTHG